MKKPKQCDQQEKYSLPLQLFKCVKSKLDNLGRTNILNYEKKTNFRF